MKSIAFAVMAVLYMFAPATAAFLTQKLIWKEPWRDLGLKMPRLPWMAVAWLLPLLLVVVALAVSLALPGVSLVTGFEDFITTLAGKMPPDKAADLHKKLKHTILAAPGMLLLVSFLQILIDCERHRGLRGRTRLARIDVALWFHLRGRGDIFDDRVRE